MGTNSAHAYLNGDARQPSLCRLWTRADADGTGGCAAPVQVGWGSDVQHAVSRGCGDARLNLLVVAPVFRAGA